uniref:RING-type domain-containing protein n=1 Tax=Ficedula albicollis TaxID=59894 RepID=U3KIZ3_FICAL
MERLEEELTCAICCDTFREPRLLPCSHTFCAPCLQRLLQPQPAAPAALSLRCPTCRAPVARCQGALQSHREAVLKCFKELGDALEQKKAALLSALDDVERCVSEKYDPLIEEVEKLKLEEKELEELHSALQKEESPLLFLEKLQGLQQRFQALGEKQLPEPEPLEVQPSVEKVLQDISTTEVGQLHKILNYTDSFNCCLCLWCCPCPLANLRHSLFSSIYISLSSIFI